MYIALYENLQLQKEIYQQVRKPRGILGLEKIPEEAPFRVFLHNWKIGPSCAPPKYSGYESLYVA